jgi:ABC-2 type transport system ATP-binding protein
MQTPENAILVQDLVKIYKPTSANPVTALNGLSLSVRRGEVFGLLGRNGAGKTTLLRILTTLVRPTSGDVRVLGFQAGRQDLDIRKNICVVLQENSVEMFLSVWDNLLTYARFHSVPRDDRRVRARRVIQQFGLEEVANQKLNDLSGGMKRRVQVAKVFMVEKPLVFLDEATTGLDPINKRVTMEAIREQARQGRTIFLTTHVLHEAEELCDTIAIIEQGKRIAVGDLRTIKALIGRSVDISITFGDLDDATMEQLHRLPLLKLSRSGLRVDMSIQGDGPAPLELLTSIVRQARVEHIEMNSTSLEDVFVSLLGRKNA